MKELISVIIPAYNAEQYIGRCILSVLSQTYENLEIIIVDDGSTDNTKMICNTFARKDKRIKLFSKDNGGTSSARNLGLMYAQGKYISFLDNDDWIEPSFYETLQRLIVEESADLSIVSYNQVFEDTKVAKLDSEKICTYDKKGAIVELLLDEVLQNYVWNKLYKKELFDGIKFPENIIYDDINVMSDIFQRCEKIVSYEYPLYNYRYRENSIINSRSHKKFEDEYKAVLIRYDDINQNIPEIDDYNAYSLIIWVIRIYYFMAKENDTNDTFLKSDFKKIIAVFEKYKEYVLNKMSSKKKVIWHIMLWDWEKGKRLVREL